MTDPTRDCSCVEPVEHTPLAVDPAPFQSTVVYRVGRHPSFLASMQAELSASPDLALFTTRDPGDPVLALLDSWATVLDVLTFYQERILNEGLLGTATERRSILELAHLIGYKLAPGVSAETYLAFSTDEIPNSPLEVQLPKGSKVQSIPFETGELPQTFETSVDLTAKTPLNDMRLELALYTEPAPGDSIIYLDVADAQLKTGDALAILGNERIASAASRRWQVRRVLSAETIPEDPVSRQPARTVVTLEAPLGADSRLPQTGIRAFAFRQRAGVFGHNAQPWETLPLSLRLGELPPLIAANPIDDIEFTLKSKSPETGAIAMMKDSSPGISDVSSIYKGIEFFSETNNLIIGPFAGRVDTWADAHFDSTEDYIYLDQVYDNVVAGGWLMLRKAIAGGTDEELYFIEEAAEVSHTDFNITAKVTRVRLSGTGLDKFSPRNATVYCASDAVAWARKPIEAPISGITLQLEQQINELVEGQLVSIRGQDESGADSAMIRTIDTITSVAARGSAEMQDSVLDTTEITLTRDITPPLIRDSVRINGNVVAANHGETRSEPIGSGNAALAFQVFDLPGRPLAYVSAAGGSGRASTLALRVNDILWKEASDFLDAGQADRIFRQDMDNEGKVSLTFGDGVTGARLPTGSNNLTATYRVGTGLAGLLDADRLTQPMTRPVGLRAVTNPLASAGAEDPESLETARTNAPTSVKTLGRIVSLTDYEDFARTFAGIAKAAVTSLWDGTRTLVHLTISGADGAAFGPEDKTYTNLVAAIDAARPRGQPLRIDSGDLVPVTIAAEVWVHADFMAESVLTKVRESLESAYCFDARAYARPLAASEVMTRIQAIDGIEGTRLTAFHRTIDADPTGPAPVEALLLAASAHVEDGEIQRAEILTLAPEDLTLLEAAS